jgi:hypothetical protein
MRIPILCAALCLPCWGQSLSDTQIGAALDAGRHSSGKRLWAGIKKNQQVRLNRASFADPIEKRVTFLADGDRIELEAAEAKRQLREVSVEEIRNNFALGVVDVLLEANCYNSMYAGSLPKWGPSGGVHLVLEVEGSVIQPINRLSGRADSAAVLPQEHGVISRQGQSITYTPLYRSAVYERASQRTWFEFPTPPAGTNKITIVAISGDGKQRRKEIANPFR